MMKYYAQIRGLRNRTLFEIGEYSFEALEAAVKKCFRERKYRAQDYMVSYYGVDLETGNRVLI